MKLADARVQAIRLDVLVGAGSCSYVQEFWDDQEIVVELDKQGIYSIEDAIDWAVKIELSARC
jgi:hypothetical protein